MNTNTKEVVPSITATSTVTELINYIKLSPTDCSEAETILVNREKELKMELENLRKDYDIMVRRHSITEDKKLEYETELIASRKICHKLNEKSTISDQTLLVEQRNKITIIAELHKKIKSLEKAEKEKRDFIEKIDRLEKEKNKMNEKIENLIKELDNEKKEKTKKECSSLVNKKRKRSENEGEGEGEGDDKVFASTEKVPSLLSSNDGTIVDVNVGESIDGKNGAFPFIKECNVKDPASSDSSGRMDNENKWMYKWMCAGDFLEALKQEPELCVNVAIVLYRQRHRFSEMDISRINGLADFYIHIDPDNWESLSFSEIQAQYPEMVEESEKLVILHYKKLFDIYQEDGTSLLF